MIKYKDVKIGDVFEIPMVFRKSRIIVVGCSIFFGLQMITSLGTTLEMDKEVFEEYVKRDMKLVARNKRVIVSVEN